MDRRERLRKLASHFKAVLVITHLLSDICLQALETIDLNKDPYILRNHLGGVECRLCLTLHTKCASC